ncbi:EamA family transporter [Candidatus Micrarchaeota archaeon]|nr:EamA family transporter [Candidatus Micrarchaeota archaeon]
MESWIVYALVAVLLLGVSNFLFKTVVNAVESEDLKLEAAWPVLAVFFGAALLVALAYVYFVIQPPATLLLSVAALAVLSMVAVGFIFLSLKTGKVAVVTALLGLSAVVVGVLSYAFLGDRFSAKELVGMGLALAAVWALAA